MQPIIAADFSTTLHTTYTIEKSGPTQVTADFVITNLTSTKNSSKFAIEISSPDIQSVRVYNQDGDIQANIVPTDLKVAIGIDFPDQVVGKDKQRTFSVSYLHPNIVNIDGSVAEVHIPRLVNPQEFSSTVTTIQLPEEFGQPTVALPSTFESSTQDGKNIFTYQNIGQAPITMLFGKEQTYNFSLTYVLSNPSGTKGIVQVPLPPDTLYQRLSYQKLEPFPQELKADPDGNWIATYSLESQQQQEIHIQGQATTFVVPQKDFPVPQVRDEYTKADTFWEIHEAEFETLAHQLKTPQQIFAKITEELEYNFSRKGKETNRTGAIFAYEHPTNALAQDYTDVFVSIARAANIPARQLTGYAFSSDPTTRPVGVGQSDFHVWPEYYHQQDQTWYAVDPTWSDTSGFEYFQALDFRRLVLAIQGTSSQQPLPPGIYPQEGVALKDPLFQLAESVQEVQPEVDVTISSNLGVYFGFGSRYTIHVENKTGQALYNVPVQLQSDNQVIVDPDEYELDSILPFQKVSFPITVSSSNVVDDASSQVSVTILEKQYNFPVTANSIITQFSQNPLLLFGTVSIILGVIIGCWLLFMIFRGSGKKKKK